jgi:leader peptidase (prepilin peptidase)/N-methyltransferase
VREVFWLLMGSLAAFLGWRGAARTSDYLRATGPVWGEAHMSPRRSVAATCMALGAVAAFLAARHWGDITMVASLAMIAVSTRIALVDIDTHVIPGGAMVLGWFAGLPLLALATATGDGTVRGMALGAGIAWVLLAFVHLLSRGDMGAGDVALGAMLGAHAGWVSWETSLLALFWAVVIGGAAGAGLLATRRVSRRTFVPFGPFLVAGAWIAVLR